MDISGIFNIASGNYTVGEVGDIVREVVEKSLSLRIKLNIKHIQDYRNYKVSVEKASDILSVKPRHDAESIVRNLLEHVSLFSDFENPNYYNIKVFEKLNIQAR